MVHPIHRRPASARAVALLRVSLGPLEHKLLLPFSAPVLNFLPQVHTDIEALKEAITYDGPTGDMELPSLVTTQKSIRAEQDTMTIVVDGREMTVLESTFIVSPNSVDYHGRKLTTKQEWISTLENLEAEGLWCAQTKGTQPAKILQKVRRCQRALAQACPH